MSALTKIFIILLVIAVPYIVIESNRQANDPSLNQASVTPAPQQSEEWYFDEQLGTYISNDGQWQWNEKTQQWEPSAYWKVMEFIDKNPQYTKQNVPTIKQNYVPYDAQPNNQNYSYPAIPIPTFGTTYKQMQDPREKYCEKIMSDYTRCMNEYTTQLGKYVSCKNNSSGSGCSEPINMCSKSICD